MPELPGVLDSNPDLRHGLAARRHQFRSRTT